MSCDVFPSKDVPFGFYWYCSSFKGLNPPPPKKNRCQDNDSSIHLVPSGLLQLLYGVTVLSRGCSQSIMLLHAWFLVPDGVTISDQSCCSYTRCQKGDGSLLGHAPRWLADDINLLSTVLVAYFDQHLTGCVVPWLVLAIKASVSLDHMCGTLCHCLCNKTLTTDSSAPTTNISALELDSHGA